MRNVSGSGGPVVVSLAEAASLGAGLVGQKAWTLSRLAGAGFPVPDGFVVTTAAWEAPPERLARQVGRMVDRFPGVAGFAVRSSAAGEDLVGASYAGQYDTFLNVPPGRVAEQAQRHRGGEQAGRVTAYRAHRVPSPRTDPADSGADRGDLAAPMAVLVQPMVPATAAGVAFTADPVTGDRDQTLVTAVRGVAERLVGGESTGDQWRVHGQRATPHRVVEDAVTADQALAVAALARRAEHLLGSPQDVEWAIEPTGAETPDAPDAGWWRVVLLQSRPMTALPDPVTWTAPGPGVWHRNFRLGEWLPEPVTPLFADWLLPLLEAGYLDGMRDTTGTVVPFPYAVVNGWYFNSPPRPSLALLLKALRESRGRIVPVLANAIVRVSRNPVAADRALLARLEQTWRRVELPRYQALIEHGWSRLAAQNSHDSHDSDGLDGIIDQVTTAAGRQLWFLAIVGGSAWKIEARLARFLTERLPHLLGDGRPLPDGAQTLLRPLPGLSVTQPGHAVFSLDWYWPTAGETHAPVPPDLAPHPELAMRRDHGEAACRDALAGTRWLLRFERLLQVARRYARTREEQAAALTLGWPLLRACADRLAAPLVAAGRLNTLGQVHFLTHAELRDPPADSSTVAASRQAAWDRCRRRPAPLTLGTPTGLIGDPLQRAVEQARAGHRAAPADAIVGQPASAGRASGPVRLITDPDQLDSFQLGEVLLARATAPAWTPLFARAAAVVTDGGAITAHASIVAREYGIPAVVGTGDATHRLTTGQWVTVDGTTGIVHTTPARPR
jgi:phosphohistidine swiveling domain-containing protein